MTDRQIENMLAGVAELVAMALFKDDHGDRLGKWTDVSLTVRKEFRQKAYSICLEHVVTYPREP